ncbi:PLP-dependent aminotransferase family protein [Anoxybacterium hadale]|uniref:PLP-dependent aminotransferase family protein n=1 Tax=Anoxybacterium hadale TaxID=3408580 RepID=A0ACD1A9I7_9FIRM|nr:PLP-dependent aminotransferase family protein [Clostridiales bacterium]
MLFIELDRTHERSFTKQIYIQIRKKIVSGLLKAGDRLPSTRELSKDLGVARNTVLTAYELLVSEEFLYSLPGAGFYVGPEISRVKQPVQIGDSIAASLSDMTLPNELINFDSGLPALDLFPRSKWNHAAAKALNEAPASVLGYDDPQGRPELREALSGYLKRTRGIECRPEQIIITSGTKQGLTLVAKSLLNDKSEVWIEDPTNENVKQIFLYHTNKIIPFSVDEHGITPYLFPRDRKPTLIFVTPSHQFPMGGILPIKRRLELVEFARKSGCYILEDDYDSEFTYQGLPANSLYEFDSKYVIHAGTFSKTMFPSLRLGYLVVPNKLVPLIREWKRLADHHSNSIYQLALMRFLESGEMERHIRRMKKVYLSRRDHLLALLRKYFGDNVTVYGFHAGMHIVAEFVGGSFPEETIRQLLNRGIYVVPVEKHAIVKGNHSSQIILGYASLCYDDMERGLEILKEVLEEHY